MSWLAGAAARAVRLLPPEAAHHVTLALLRGGGGLLPRASADPPSLHVHALGLDLPNPVGIAAGFDKDAEVSAALLKFGFGFVECGTVTPRPQAGNPRPRLFRLAEDRAIVNRMGFNSRGAAHAARRLIGRRMGIVGINIGANRDAADRIADYRAGFAALAPHADYVAVNVSSPNTPGLRGLQDRAALEALLGTLSEERARLARPVPVLLKIAPDLDMQALDAIVDVARAAALDGIIATNTTVARPSALKSPHAREAGGLSGAPLFAPSTEIVRALYARVGPEMVLVGVGGISSGAGAYAKIRAGATLVQLYTALAYEGPGLVARIKRELAGLLARDGYASVADAVGADHR